MVSIAAIVSGLSIPYPNNNRDCCMTSDQLQQQLQSILSCSKFGHFTPGLLSTVGIFLPICILPQAPVVQTMDSTSHWIKHYLLDKSIGFPSAYPVD